jgi:hypothetical protein
VTTWYVAIDDTDNLESIGTGRLARMLADHLEAAGLLSDTSVTRHQLLVHPDIPYTSHNSSACIGGVGDAGARDALAETARAFLGRHFHAGSNPGLCVCPADAVPSALVEIGRRAQRDVLRLDAFDREVSGLGVTLWSSGDTGQGRIGAASGVGLRRSGEDGRFIGLRGIRELAGVIAVRDVLARSAIRAVESEAGERLPAETIVDTDDWVRPALRGGHPVFVVREEHGRWVPAERRIEDA